MENTDFIGDLVAFTHNLATTIHETTHLLGFSSTAFPFWIDKTTNAKYTSIITT